MNLSIKIISLKDQYKLMRSSDQVTECLLQHSSFHLTSGISGSARQANEMHSLQNKIRRVIECFVDLLLVSSTLCTLLLLLEVSVYLLNSDD